MAFSNSWVVISCNLSYKWPSWNSSNNASSHDHWGHLQPSVGQGKKKNNVVVQYYHKQPTTMSNDDLKTKFMQVYHHLKSELIHDPSFEFDDTSRQWVDRMIDYNVPGGKMIRGLSVLESYQLLKGEHQLTDNEIFLASSLGGCIEWLQAYLLVHDDIIDDAHIRRGQHCWFRLPEVGMIAVNDAVLLRNHIPRILKRHFSGKDYYVNLLDLFNEAEFQTVSGQMIDTITTLVGEKDLSNYSLSLNRRILKFKCSYYSCYLPVACALLMFGENLDDHVQMKDILMEMGIYGQVQDDYFDTFGDPNVVGKVGGKDIENFKCSWLVAKALELSNKEQRIILNENYGKKDPAKVAKVKELYHTLNLESVYEEYENQTYAEFIKSIEALPRKAVQAILKSLLTKLYKRQK